MKYLKPFAEIPEADLQELEEKLAGFYAAPPAVYHAGAVAGNKDWSDPAHELHRRIAARVSRGAQVLDVGCGAAVPADRFIAAGASYTGLDAYPGVAAGREGGPGFKFIAGDWRGLPDLGLSFDLVVSFFVLEHIPRPRSFLSASASAVKRGGLLAVLCPEYLRRGSMPSQHFFGSRPGGISEKLRALDLPEVLRTAADKYFGCPSVFRRAARAGAAGGAWLINLRPVCLEAEDWKADWDAVYAAGEDEVAGYIGGLGFEILERGREIDAGRHGFCYVLGRKL